MSIYGIWAPVNSLENVLVEKIGTKHLIVGYDHHFGKGREGDFKTISECALKFGFTVEQVCRGFCK